MLDVVGFVNYCGSVHWVSVDGYFEKEFQLILQSSPSDISRSYLSCYNFCAKSFSTLMTTFKIVRVCICRPNQQVRCCLSGAWVEAVYKDIEEATKLTPHPFVLLRYLVSAQPIDGLHIFQGTTFFISDMIFFTLM